MVHHREVRAGHGKAVLFRPAHIDLIFSARPLVTSGKPEEKH